MMDELPAVVEAARRGDATAWAALVHRFEDFAVAVALGRGGDWDGARDVAQDAFLLAVSRIDELNDPAAFPGWFAALVRTACSRRARRPAPTPTEAVIPEGTSGGPDEEVIRTEQAREARAAVEALPEPERLVIALRYLADQSYAEIAAFAGISQSAARKRAFSARQRMKEMMPVISHQLAGARPSVRDELTDSVLLFAAIRHHDHATIAALLHVHPELVHEREAWSWAQAVELRLRHAEDGTPLIRAVESGDPLTVEMLLRAGAPVDGRCACAGAETPLWTAVSLGHREIVEQLLAAGADPNATAFAGVTTLHAAAHAHPALMERLIAAGADGARPDRRGRIAADWLELRGPRARAREDGSVLPSGIRALDLFAPIARGSIQYWPPAIKVGQTVVLYELIGALAPAEAWWLGFAYGPYDHTSLENSTRQYGVPGHYRLAPEGVPDGERRALFEEALGELTSTDHEKVVILLTAPGFRHDITATLPSLAGNRSVLTTIVVEPLTASDAATADRPPEGYGMQVAFDPVRARRRLFPAIAHAGTITTSWPSPRHEQTAQAARSLLDAYAQLDPDLALPEPTVLPDPALASWAQRLLRYLRQPFAVAEAFSSIPGESTPIPELLATVEEILRG